MRTGGLSGGETPEGDGSTSLTARPPRVKNYPVMSGGQCQSSPSNSWLLSSPMTLCRLHKFRVGEPKWGRFLRASLGWVLGRRALFLTQAALSRPFLSGCDTVPQEM